MDPLVADLSAYVQRGCARVRKNVKEKQSEPTDLEIANFTHTFVHGLQKLLETVRRKETRTTTELSVSFDRQCSLGPIPQECSPPEKSPSSEDSPTTTLGLITGRLAAPFAGLYDFPRNRLLCTQPCGFEEDPSTADAPLGGTDSNSTNSSSSSSNSSSSNSSSSNSSRCTGKRRRESGNLRLVTEEEYAGKDPRRSSSRSSGSTSTDEESEEVGCAWAEGAGGSGGTEKRRPPMVQRFTLEHLFWILNSLEDVFCSGNQVLHRLAADDVHARVREWVAKRKFQYDLWCGGICGGGAKKSTGSLWREPSKVHKFERRQLSYVLFLPQKVHVTLSLEEDHHLFRWRFEIAGKEHSQQSLFWAPDFPYSRD